MVPATEPRYTVVRRGSAEAGSLTMMVRHGLEASCSRGLGKRVEALARWTASGPSLDPEND